jgi:hypothetical protein
MFTTPHKNDSFSDFMRDTLGAPGQSGLDLYAQSPGRRSINRIFENTRMTGRETKEYSVPARWVIRSGTCVALCEDGLVRPALLEYALERIVGFCIRTMAGDRVSVRAGGAVVLSVQGIGLNGAGETVFAIGPNTFTLDSNAGGLPLGTVKHLEAAGALVAFGVKQKDPKGFYAAPGKHY